MICLYFIQTNALFYPLSLSNFLSSEFLLREFTHHPRIQQLSSIIQIITLKTQFTMALKTMLVLNYSAKFLIQRNSKNLARKCPILFSTSSILQKKEVFTFLKQFRHSYHFKQSNSPFTSIKGFPLLK